jgi:hypothetical protein
MTKETVIEQSAQLGIGGVSSSSVIENQLCPMCREKGSLKYKSYLMFSRVCRNDGTYVKLPTHPDYGK